MLNQVLLSPQGRMFHSPLLPDRHLLPSIEFIFTTEDFAEDTTAPSPIWAYSNRLRRFRRRRLRQCDGGLRGTVRSALLARPSSRSRALARHGPAIPGEEKAARMARQSGNEPARAQQTPQVCLGSSIAAMRRRTSWYGPICTSGQAQ
jgi:hypothetical protein